MKRGDIVELKDGYRIYADATLGLYYFTTDYQTALSLSKELNEEI